MWYAYDLQDIHLSKAERYNNHLQVPHLFVHNVIYDTRGGTRHRQMEKIGGFREVKGAVAPKNRSREGDDKGESTDSTDNYVCLNFDLAPL